ncbi:TPA: fimbrial protein [Salmonella enterica subsp. enterica serovar Java]
MMNNRIKQADVGEASSSHLGHGRYWMGNLVTSCFLVGAMMMSVAPRATAATSTTVNLSTTVNVATCEFSLSNAHPALRKVDASEIVNNKSVELGFVTLTLANCSGSLAGTNKSLQVSFSGSTQRSLGGRVSYDGYILRDSSSTAKNIGFALKWASTTAPWGTSNLISPDTQNGHSKVWPGSANADLTALAKGGNSSVNVAYSLTAGNNSRTTVTAGTVKSTLTITLSIA